MTPALAVMLVVVLMMVLGMGAGITTLELRQQRKGIADKMGPLAEKAALSADEEKEFDGLRAEALRLGKAIERQEFTAGERKAVDTLDPLQTRTAPETAPKPKGKILIPNPGFENIGELIYCHRFAPSDKRILALMEMNVGESGGAAVPDEFSTKFLEVTPAEAIVRPRATTMPQGGAPDAALTIPALQQGAAGNMYGGVTVDWIAEGGTKPETQAKLKDVTLQPKEVAAHIVVTDKLLRNWQACAATVERLLRGALLAAEDVAFLTGNGMTRPLGAIVGPARKLVNRQEALKIGYLDLVNMEAEFLDSPAAVWVVSKRAVRQLRIMEDNAGQLIWSDPKAGMPATLMGRPVVISYRSPALGSLGDIMLADFTYYLIRDGASLQVAASPHVFFRENKTVIKAFKTVDAAPWPDGPFLQEDGQTYSPFVVLDVP